MLNSASAKPEEQKKKVEVYNGDEVLKRLGALDGTRFDPLTSFADFLRQLKTDKTTEYFWLQKQLKNIAELEEKGVGEEIAAQKKTCERVLVEYLWELAKKVNEKFFFILIIFVKAYKECMNEYGWEVLRKYKQVTFEDRRKDFVTNNDAEHIPEVCNDFVRYFLPREHPTFDKNLAIELTRHLCEWVRKSKYTHTCVSLM